VHDLSYRFVCLPFVFQRITARFALHHVFNLHYVNKHNF